MKNGEYKDRLCSVYLIAEKEKKQRGKSAKGHRGGVGSSAPHSLFNSSVCVCV